MLGVAETSRHTGGLFSASKPQMRNKSTMFSLGKRGEVLTTDLEAPVIVPHAAQKQETKVCWTQSFIKTWLFRQHQNLMETSLSYYRKTKRQSDSTKWKFFQNNEVIAEKRRYIKHYIT